MIFDDITEVKKMLNIVIVMFAVLLLLGLLQVMLP